MSIRGGTLEAARRRITKGTQRDLSVANAGDIIRPSAPGYIGDVFVRASKQTGTLADALGPQPLDRGMVDTSSGVPILSVPRFTSGGAVAVQASQNAGNPRDGSGHNGVHVAGRDDRRLGIQAQELFPGTVVASAGIPSNLGAGTKKDVAIIVERSNVLLAMGQPAFRVDENTGSSTPVWRRAAPSALARAATHLQIFCLCVCQPRSRADPPTNDRCDQRQCHPERQCPATPGHRVGGAFCGALRLVCVR